MAAAGAATLTRQRRAPRQMPAFARRAGAGAAAAGAGGDAALQAAEAAAEANGEAILLALLVLRVLAKLAAALAAAWAAARVALPPLLRVLTRWAACGACPRAAPLPVRPVPPVARAAWRSHGTRHAAPRAQARKPRAVPAGARVHLPRHRVGLRAR